MINVYLTQASHDLIDDTPFKTTDTHAYFTVERLDSKRDESIVFDVDAMLSSVPSEHWSIVWEDSVY